MAALARIRGFLPYLAMIFLNSMVDLGHKIVIQNSVFKSYDGSTQIILSAIVNGLILLPFILMFTPAGYLSDKYPKNQVMKVSAWVAVVLTLVITLCYYQSWFYLAFAMTFMLALQSALYSPSKYGYIKELVGKDRLAQANGFVQAATTVAILSGIFLFSILFEQRLAGQIYKTPNDIFHFIAPLGWVLVMLAVVELLMAYRLPEKMSRDDSMVFEWPAYRKGELLRKNLRLVTNQRTIWLSIIGLSIFWAIAQVVIAAFPAFAKDSMGLENTVVIQGMLAVTGIGIMLGSISAGRISQRYIETGMLPISAIGVALCLFIMPRLDSVSSHVINFLVLGACGGFFIVPLNALIQFQAGEHQAGKVLAGNNLIQNVIMISFLALTVVFSYFGLSSVGLMMILTLAAIFGAVYTVYQLPQSLTRFVIGTMFTRRYRIKVQGFDYFPENGGVLLLGNHISWIDWAIVQIASPRPIRFVMLKSIYERWYLQWFLKFFGAIPVAPGDSKQALIDIEKLLNNGEVVCMFPEGAISRSGQLGEFYRGFERAAANTDAQLVPFYLQGLWGSRFSRSSEKLKWQSSSGIKRDLIVAFGRPLPTHSTAEVVKQKVFELSIVSWEEYSNSMEPLPYAWINAVKRAGNEMSMADSSGETLSNQQALVRAALLSKQFKHLAHGTNLGLLLPASSAAAVSNMAALMAAKTVVNLNYTASHQALSAAIGKAELSTVISSRAFIKTLEKKGAAVAAILNNCEVIYLEDIAAKLSRVKGILISLWVKILPTFLLKHLLCKRQDIDDRAAILFSSGSEGEPKGVCLSHRNIMSNLTQVANVLNTEEQDVVMAILPTFHAFGLTATTFMPLIEGIPMVCHPDPTDTLNIAKTIAKYKASILCATPTFLRLFSRNPKVHPLMLESLRITVAGAEKLSPEVAAKFSEQFHKELIEGYGATETSPVVAVNLPDRLDTSYWKVQVGNKPGSVGLPLPGTSFRIVDPDTYEAVAVEDEGLILVAGPQVMLGYLDEPQKTAAAFVELDGHKWYITGDKGRIDVDGFLYITDRFSRFAKLAGEMVSLAAVEKAVSEQLADPEVEVLAVTIPNDKKGEQIVLLSDAPIDSQNLKQKLLAAGLSPLLIPSEYYTVAAIPKLGSGKTDYAEAKKLALSK